MAESFPQPIDLPNTEQLEQRNSTYKFLRSAIESNPDTTLDRRLLGLSGVLIGLSDKNQAIQVINEVIDKGTFFASFEHKYGQEVVGKLLYLAGDATRAKEFLIERKSEYEEKSFDSYDNEDLIFMSKTFIECDLRNVAKQVLDNASVKMVDLNNITTRRMYDFVMNTYLGNDFTEEAKTYLTTLENSLVDYSKSEGKYDWHPSVLIEGYINAARWTAQLYPESPKIQEYVDMAIQTIEILPKDYGDKQPHPTYSYMVLMARSGFEDKIEPFAELMKKPTDVKRGYMAVAEEFAKQDKKELAEKYYALGQKTQEKTIDLSKETWESQLSILSYLGKTEEIDGLIRDFSEMISSERYKNTSGYWNNISGFMGTLGEVGHANRAETFIRKEFLEDGQLGTYSIQELAEALGKNASPEFLLDMLCHTNPEDRLRIILGDYEYDDKYDFKRLVPYITGTPSSNEISELKKYVLLSSEPNAWKNVTELIKSRTDGSDQNQVVDSLKFLLLEFGSSYEIDRVLSILPLLKEKMSLNRLDGYRAIVGNENVATTLLYSNRRAVLSDLAQRGVISEAKHLLYLDGESVDRIESMLDIYIRAKGDTEEAYSFLTKIINHHTVHVSSVMLCVDTLKLDLRDKVVQEDITQAITSLGGITPLLFEQFRKTSGESRQEFVTGVKKLHDMFYKNIQLTPDLLGLDQESFDKLLAEYITVLYRPVGFSSDKVREYIDRIKMMSYERDLTQELNQRIKLGGEHWNTEKGCYLIDIDIKDQTLTWKEGKSLDIKTKQISEMLDTQSESLNSIDQNTLDTVRVQAVVSLMKQGKTIQPQDARVKIVVNNQKPSVLSALVSFLPKDSVDTLHQLNQTIQTNDPTQIHQSFMRAREIIGVKTDQGHIPGVTTQDNWKESVKAWILTLDERSRGDISRSTGKEDLEEVVTVLYDSMENNLFSKVRDQINREEKKMEAFGTLGSSEGKKRVRFYVSKNIPSFFAKASAGICTADDIELFTREDHFHINIVDDESENVIGNVQAYLPVVNEQTVLMLRGINPTASFVTQGNASGIIEGAFVVGNEIVDSTGLSSLNFSESLGGWHAHSNRPEIATILDSQYLVKDREIPLAEPYVISKTTKIEKMYRIYENPKVKSNQSKWWQPLVNRFRRTQNPN